MDIGTRLRKLLEEDGITQKQLAKDLNISTTTLNGYVQNRRQPDAKMINRLASYFNTTTDYLYGRTDFREHLIMPYRPDERHLVNIYRSIPDGMKPLYIETGKTFLRTLQKSRPEKKEKDTKNK